MSAIAVSVFLLLFCVCAQAVERSSSVRTAFQHSFPCPSNGSTHGSCPGYVADHMVALCVGGKDEVANLRWQSVAKAKAKDRWECGCGWLLRLNACPDCYTTP